MAGPISRAVPIIKLVRVFIYPFPFRSAIQSPSTSWTWGVINLRLTHNLILFTGYLQMLRSTNADGLESSQGHR